MTWQEDYVRSIAADGYKITCERMAAEVGRLKAMVDVLVSAARIYVDAFEEDDMMTMPERLRLQQIEDILADPEHWSPDRPIGGAS